MRGEEFSAAYSAYLLAKSLGASGMVENMLEAQRRNIKKLQDNAARLAFQAGLQQAKTLSDTNLTQSLRLLEFLRKTYPNPTGSNEAEVLRTVSEVVTKTEQGLYKIKKRRPERPTDYVASADTVKSDGLTKTLQRQVDSVFQQLSVPPYKPRPGFDMPPLTGEKEQRGYHYIARHHLLFTFYSYPYAYHEQDKTVKLDSSFSAILWLTDGDHLTRLHTFVNKFGRLPRVSPDGRTLVVQLEVSNLEYGNLLDSLYKMVDNQLIKVGGFPDSKLAGREFAWFSPDDRYVVMHSATMSGQGIIWRKINADLHYMMTVEEYAESIRFEGETITLELSNLMTLNYPYINTITTNLNTQQTILPPFCRYQTAAENVFFSGGNSLLAAYVTDKPHVILHAIQDWWLTPKATFWGDFTGGSVTPDGRYVVLRPRDNTLPAELWIADYVDHFHRKEGLSPSFEDAVFSPDSRLALFSDRNRPGQLQALDSTGFRVVHTFNLPFKATDCQFSPDGKWLYVNFLDNAYDSLWQVTPKGLLPAAAIPSMDNTTTIRYQPDSNELAALLLGNRAMQYYQLKPGAVEVTKEMNDVLPVSNALYVFGDQIVYSTTDTYMADRTKKVGFNLLSTKLSKGTLASPVFDDGETLFFVAYSDLSRRYTLVGYDKTLHETVLSREVSARFDLTMTVDKNIRLADLTGLYTIVPPRRILRLLQTKEVAPLTDDLRIRFSPIKP